MEPKDIADLRHCARVLAKKGYVELPLKLENMALRLERELGQNGFNNDVR